MLGDRIAEALAAVGLTPGAVSHWLGAPCNCEERKARLNSLDLWARRAAAGKLGGAREFLSRLMSDR